ncbi:MAG: GNAT family N-acetyltransferase [Candidatus Pacebacteria bacterium]|nr:GNAT family N-acetyltransferase [Candidatus Paceibacterota bacterium]
MEVKLKKADKNDKQFLFGLRNKPYVYENSGTPRPVKWQEHTDWLEKVLSGEANKELFIIEFKEEPAGQIRFDFNNSKAIVNISLLKEFQNKGIAFSALQAGIEKMKEEKQIKTFIAEVYQDNIASQKLFEKLEFQFQSQKDVWKTYEKRI